MRTRPRPARNLPTQCDGSPPARRRTGALPPTQLRPHRFTAGRCMDGKGCLGESVRKIDKNMGQ